LAFWTNPFFSRTIHAAKFTENGHGFSVATPVMKVMLSQKTAMTFRRNPIMKAALSQKTAISRL
jgi:hypothetical protein